MVYSHRIWQSVSKKLFFIFGKYVNLICQRYNYEYLQLTLEGKPLRRLDWEILSIKVCFVWLGCQSLFPQPPSLWHPTLPTKVKMHSNAWFKRQMHSKIWLVGDPDINLYCISKTWDLYCWEKEGMGPKEEVK